MPGKLGEDPFLHGVGGLHHELRIVMPLLFGCATTTAATAAAAARRRKKGGNGGSGGP